MNHFDVQMVLAWLGGKACLCVSLCVQCSTAALWVMRTQLLPQAPDIYRCAINISWKAGQLPMVLLKKCVGSLLLQGLLQCRPTLDVVSPAQLFYVEHHFVNCKRWLCGFKWEYCILRNWGKRGNIHESAGMQEGYWSDSMRNSNYY